MARVLYGSALTNLFAVSGLVLVTDRSLLPFEVSWRTADGYIITAFGNNLGIDLTGTFFGTATDVRIASSSGQVLLVLRDLNTPLLPLSSGFSTSAFLAGDDSITGTANADVIYGLGGNDIVDGGFGDDLIYGGNGNDILGGNGGNDRVYGDAGDDTVVGGGGDDLLWGGDGNDTVYGDDGADIVDGGFGDDLIYGGNGNDILGGNGGNDRVYGDAGNDKLVGGGGNDLLWGGEGNDSLMGDDGNDVLRGGAGNDILTGGAGADTFVFDRNWGRDSILDWQGGVDHIDARMLGVQGVHSLADLTLNSAGTVLSFQGNTITFAVPVRLTNADFLFG